MTAQDVHTAALADLRRRIEAAEAHLSPEARRDECGLLPRDYRAIADDVARWHERNRWRALLTLWSRPVFYQHFGEQRIRSAQGEDWTFWRAMRASIGMVLARYWTDAAQKRFEDRHGYGAGLDMAFWDARTVYGGYDGEVLWLYPRCRVLHFNDGEVNL